MGMWLFALYEGRRTPLHVVLGPVERGFYKLAGIDPNAEQSWRRYAVHMLLFKLTLLLFTYAVLRLQDGAAAEPARACRRSAPDGAMNTAISFTTNTNWQWYSGEVALSNLSQMLGADDPQFPVAPRPASPSPSRCSAASRGAQANGDRQFLGGYARASRSICCCRSASSTRSS